MKYICAIVLYICAVLSASTAAFGYWPDPWKQAVELSFASTEERAILYRPRTTIYPHPRYELSEDGPERLCGEAIAYWEVGPNEEPRFVYEVFAYGFPSSERGTLWLTLVHENLHVIYEQLADSHGKLWTVLHPSSEKWVRERLNFRCPMVWRSP